MGKIYYPLITRITRINISENTSREVRFGVSVIRGQRKKTFRRIKEKKRIPANSAD